MYVKNIENKIYTDGLSIFRSQELLPVSLETQYGCGKITSSGYLLFIVMLKSPFPKIVNEKNLIIMKWRNDVKKSIMTILKSSHKRTIGPTKKSSPIYLRPNKRSSPIYLGPKKLLCNRINGVSWIEEQRRILKNNEEKNRKLLLVLFKCVISIIPRIYMIYII